jgi:putative DNA primase/helicase
MSAAFEFRAAILAALGHAPEVIEPGRFHRFATRDQRGDDAGWVMLFADLHGGVYGCYRQGISETWCASERATMTRRQRADLARQVMAATAQREAERAGRHADAATAAQARWEAARPAVDHPYLSNKCIRACGVRVEGAALLVPMRDATGKLQSLQTIAPDGTKRFMPGGRVRGCYHAIGRPHGAVIACEGFATGATIHEATGQAVAVAFNAGNLEPVARTLRRRLPCASIIVAGDDDYRTPGNPGRTAAEQAALSVGGLALLPLFKAPRPPGATDFNDLAAAECLQAVRSAFAECLAVA